MSAAVPMSAAAPMSTAVQLSAGVNAAAASAPPAAGEVATPGTGPDIDFQLLIAELGCVVPADAAISPLTADSTAAPAKTTAAAARSAEHDDKTSDAADAGLIAVMAALSAWQPPNVPLPALSASPSAASALPADGQPQEFAISATGVEALAVGTADSKPQAPSAAARGSAGSDSTLLRLVNADASLTALHAPLGEPQTAPVPAPQWNDALNAAAAELMPLVRPKATSAAPETQLPPVDAATSSNLLRLPVVSSTVTRTVPVPVHDPHWPEAVATQIRWAVTDGVQSATLRLVPEHLGPVELHIELKDNQVNVNLNANQADTRQALQDSLPRLREVLAGAGIALGQASVQQESGRASQSAAPGVKPLRDDAIEPVVTHARVALGLVDLYA
jgi:flagellar hook-length control protein FliK